MKLSNGKIEYNLIYIPSGKHSGYSIFNPFLVVGGGVGGYVYVMHDLACS